MTTITPAGSVLPVRLDAACGGIGGPASLCNTLPPAEPSLDEQEHWHFQSAVLDDYCCEAELQDFHAMFQLSGIPYTVQHLPIVPFADRNDDDDSWDTHPSLTAAQRNSR
jgi:hypothetical protein